MVYLAVRLGPMATSYIVMNIAKANNAIGQHFKLVIS